MTVQLSPLYESQRECTLCPLRQGCSGPVPGNGHPQSRVFFIGEAPGQREDEADPALPFQGQAGQLFDHLLSWEGINRNEVWVDNTVKCRPTRNRTPTRQEARFCASRWLEMALGMVKPEIVVPMGAVATEYVFGKYGIEYVNMEHCHGIPIHVPCPWVPGYTMLVIPTYHPAAGLHDSARLRDVQDDFRVVGEVMRGRWQGETVDQWPSPEYIQVEASGLALEGDWSLDTETIDGNLWSLQVSDKPGSALFVIPEQVYPIYFSSAKITVHNYLYDAQYLTLPPDTVDSMLMAYLLSMPQGLKELAWRLCGMEMKSYSELVRPGRREKALAYLEEAVLGERDTDIETGVPWGYMDWPYPPLLEETRWNNKEHRLVTRQKKPQHISRKIRRILADTIDKGADPWERWHKIDARERAVVESVLGRMPDAQICDVDRDEAVWYACRDADATERVKRILWPMIRAQGLEFVFQMDSGTLPIALEMMRQGMRVDVEGLRELGSEYLKQMDTLSHEVSSKSRGGIDKDWQAINPNSDKQVARLLYQDLGFTPTKLTPTGLPSCTSEELKKVDHPVIQPILDYRHAAHIRDSFCLTLPGKADNRDRVHPTIKTTRTATGRWSMAEPNLQQIPVRTDVGRAVREQFMAEEGWTLVACDFSQIEMRVAAHLSGCQSMIQLFREGRDVHTETAATIFGVGLEEASDSRYRYPCKTLGFGVLYGLSPHGLHQQMVEEGIAGDWSEDRCAEFIQEYYRARPELKTWQDKTIEFGRRNGYVQDILGRRRYIPELALPPSRGLRRVVEEGKRKAVNMPVQSTAQGIVKLAMNRMWRDLGTGHMLRWLLQAHDELIWEVWKDMVEGFVRYAVPVMERVMELDVPVVAEAKAGERWGSMKKYEGGKAS